MASRTISIIGVGRVGSTLAHLCAQQGAGNLVLIDDPPGIAQGVALDLSQSAPVENFDISITGTGDYKDIEGSDIVCITAGARRTPGTSRDEVLLKNADIVKKISMRVAEYAPESKLLVITNPLDAITYAAYKASGFPRERVIGMAGVLDTTRFRFFVAQELKVPVHTVTALLIGGHGDRSLPVLQRCSVGKKPLAEMLSHEKIKSLIQKMHTTGDRILELENGNSAYYAPAASVIPVIRAIVKNTHETLPCSAYLNGEYGLNDICIGVPVTIGKHGIEKIVEVPLTPEEKAAFLASSKDIRRSIQNLA